MGFVTDTCLSCYVICGAPRDNFLCRSHFPTVHRVSFVLRQERSRANVLRAITYRGRLRYVFALRQAGVTLTAPASAVLDSVGALRRRLPQRLREHLENLQHVGRDVSITFQARVNTQASEQNWRLLNRHAPTLRYTRP